MKFQRLLILCFCISFLSQAEGVIRDEAPLVLTGPVLRNIEYKTIGENKMETTKYIHFFSWATRVSIELPVGFEEQIEDQDTNSAIYADDLEEPDQRDEPGARVMTKMTAVPKESTEAYLAMAKASAAVESRDVVNREEIMVNGAPAIRQTLSYRDDDLKVDVFRHETFAQLANVVFSITCLAPADRLADYRAAFDHAADTARFILLPETSVGYAHEELRISGQRRYPSPSGKRLSTRF